MSDVDKTIEELDKALSCGSRERSWQEEQLALVVHEIGRERFELTPEAEKVYSNIVKVNNSDELRSQLAEIKPPLQLVFAAKVIESEAPSDSHVRKLMTVFSNLVESGELRHGLIAPLFWIKLGPPFRVVSDAGGVRVVRDGGPEHRVQLCLFAFSTVPKEELNAKINNRLFVNEGELGNSDWSNL